MNENLFLGKYILVGVTYLNPDGTIREMIEKHGVIKRISNNTLFFICSDSTDFSIPFDERAISKAPLGTYKLRSTGEEVMNPDYFSTWTVKPPEDQK